VNIAKLWQETEGMVNDRKSGSGGKLILLFVEVHKFVYLKQIS